MFFKTVTYKGEKFMIGCTPKTTDQELMKRAKRLYEKRKGDK